MKEVHKKLDLDNVKDGDLIHIDNEEDEVSENAYSIVALSNWEQRNFL